MATLTVTTLADELDPVNNPNGFTSLREAVRDAAAGDTVVFSSAIAAGTINLTLGQLVLNKGLTIDGENRQITVSGSNSSRVFAVAGGTTVFLNDLSIISGNSLGDNTIGFNGLGGGILNFGNLTATRLNVIGNTATTAGGGIASGTGSTLVINQSTIDNNSANTFAGGLLASQANLTVNTSTISNNTAPQAGALQVQNTASAVLNNTTVSENTSTGAQNSEVILNVARAVGQANSNLVINSSTIANNSIAPNGDATRPPGVYTFADAGFTATTTLNNSIVANNTGGSTLQLATGGNGTRIVNGDFNLISDNSVLTGANNLLNTNPQLLPLGNYGGVTKTHALAANSPAINSGNTALTNDQRGSIRPAAITDDRGAFEATLTGSPINVRVTVNGGLLILGSNSSELIFGDQLGEGSNDTIAAFAGEDIIDGLAGNDSIDGGFGNDSIMGGLGSDTLLGNIGNDTLIGSRLANTAEIDILVGGLGEDRFILGDVTATFYSIGSGYAVIRDFEAGDVIQRGQATLDLDAVANPLGSGRTLSLGGNLVAVVQGSGIANLNIVQPF
ncbi:MAG: choice-of-anchor Q domain-containing protein [Pseudanabaenaceae cyanobacterium bins.68]|nr:choice-of-anchor Q domain-containing protein [Pseudanabaenaceae cyanobacterium bins.68]